MHVKSAIDARDRPDSSEKCMSSLVTLPYSRQSVKLKFGRLLKNKGFLSAISEALISVSAKRQGPIRLYTLFAFSTRQWGCSVRSRYTFELGVSYNT